MNYKDKIEVIKTSISEDEQTKIIKKMEQPVIPVTAAPKKNLYENIISYYTEKLKGTKYFIEKGNLCYKNEGRRGDENVPLCNFIPFITRETIEDDGICQKVIYNISGVMIQQESIFPEIYLPAGEFSSLSWVPANWGIRANMEPGVAVRDKIRHAAQVISYEAERDYIYTHLGWRKIFGEWVYLHAAGAIGKEGITVNLESSQIEKYQLPVDKEVDIKEAAAASLELLNIAELGITLSLLAMIGLAPLCEPLKIAGVEPAFVLWLSGPSGSKKSSLAACFQSHFGDFNSGKDLPASFRDTMNAIEKKAFLTKDSLLVIDDFHPTYSAQESQRMEQIAQQILRGYGDRVGRSRMRADTTLNKAYPPRGICLVTGEDTPKAGISTTARFLEIELQSDSINLNKLDECQKAAYYYPYVYKGYIEWLLPQMGQLPSILKRKFTQYREQFISRETHGRITEAAAWLLLGLEMLLSYYNHVNAIDNSRKNGFMESAIQEFKRLAKKHSLSVNSNDPVTLFVDALRDLIDSKSVVIIDIYDDPVTDDPHFIGWEDQDYYYLIRGKAFKEINTYLRAQDIKFPISQIMLSKLLAERDMIEIEKEAGSNRYAARAYVGKGKKQKRFLKLKKESLL